MEKRYIALYMVYTANSKSLSADKSFKSRNHVFHKRDIMRTEETYSINLCDLYVSIYNVHAWISIYYYNEIVCSERVRYGDTTTYLLTYK